MNAVVIDEDQHHVMNKTWFIRYCNGLLLLLLFASPSYAQYSLPEVPNPKIDGQDFYVSNPDDIISTWAVDSMNKIASEIDKKATVEMAIIILDDFQGEDDFEFALNLFNTWGIGKKDRNNGLLLFISKDRRAYRFISGYGLDSLLPDITLKRIGEHYLVPYFKADHYDKGLLMTMQVLKRVLLAPDSVAELNNVLKKPSFWSRNRALFRNTLIVCILFFVAFNWSSYVIDRKILPKKTRRKTVKPDYYPLLSGCFITFFLFFASIFICLVFADNPFMLLRFSYIPWYIAIVASLVLTTQYYDTIKLIKDAHEDEVNLTKTLTAYTAYMAIPILLAPLTLFSIVSIFRRRKKLKQRLIPPDTNHQWVRLNRDDLKKRTPYLNAGQAMEEHLQAKSYEIWQEEKTGMIKVTAWMGNKAKDYRLCPSCGYQTLEPPYVKTLKAATYTTAGEGEKIERCANCNYQHSLGLLALAKKVMASTSSHSDTANSSSSSSDSSGSWGGGSSGGGGAGGHW
ncbi:hypothetical protein GCM10023231_02950 [Olivibacter ginsenosidimutans]|uniref:TPM domain-containing protein n=1 Tax=Olivibacter ginsenosidimutans TaxID=1176537 RepID=A0ABP9AF57_9SPHI